jgi:hypothetical protein
LKEYKATRDGYRAGAGKEPKWALLSNAIGAHFIKKAPSRASQAAAVRVLWDKNWTGYNRSKGGGEAGCQLCGGPLETQEHVIMRCPHPAMVKVRRTVRGAINRSIASSRKEPPKIIRIMEGYRQAAYHHPQGALLWVGHLSEGLAASIGVGESLSDLEWRKTLRAVEPYFEGVMQLFAERRKLICEALLVSSERENPAGVRAPRTMREREMMRFARLNRFRPATNAGQQAITRFFPVVDSIT